VWIDIANGFQVCGVASFPEPITTREPQLDGVEAARSELHDLPYRIARGFGRIRHS
jgi:hypothetical protein